LETDDIEDVCAEITVGHVEKMANQYRQGGVPFLRSQNVRPFRFDPRELRFVSPEFHPSIGKSTLKAGDVGGVRTGAPGQCCVVPPELIEANCSDLVIVRLGSDFDSDFAAVFINSGTSQEFVRTEQVGVAQTRFNVGSMKRANRCAIADRAARDCGTRQGAFRHGDAIGGAGGFRSSRHAKFSPSTLQKAFRGELVLQDPSDEPASALLARLRINGSPPTARPTRSQTSGKRSTLR
jgi:type I restriction enzyme, S subunit